MMIARYSGSRATARQICTPRVAIDASRRLSGGRRPVMSTVPSSAIGSLRNPGSGNGRARCHRPRSERASQTARLRGHRRQAYWTAGTMKSCATEISAGKRTSLATRQKRTPTKRSVPSATSPFISPSIIMPNGSTVDSEFRVTIRPVSPMTSCTGARPRSASWAQYSRKTCRLESVATPMMIGSATTVKMVMRRSTSTMNASTRTVPSATGAIRMRVARTLRL
jgi:hypothetical protein